jgi:hypothetical protein
MFFRLHRTVEIALLACQYESDFRSVAMSENLTETDKIVRDLQNVRWELRGMIALLNDISRRVERLPESVSA